MSPEGFPVFAAAFWSREKESLPDRFLVPRSKIFSARLHSPVECDGRLRFHFYLCSSSAPARSGAPRCLFSRSLEPGEAGPVFPLVRLAAKFSRVDSQINRDLFSSCSAGSTRFDLLCLSFHFFLAGVRGLVSCSDFLLPAQIRCRSASSAPPGILRFA
jgi:hypothetical protein